MIDKHPRQGSADPSAPGTPEQVRPVAPSKDTLAMRAAAVLTWIAGLGFGLPCIYAIAYFADTGRVWTFLGFPTYGGGTFEDSGIRTTVPLLCLFLVVCTVEVVVGWLLWRRRRAGVVLGFALLPVEFAFWIGFALPFGYIVGIARPAFLALRPQRSDTS